VLDFTREVLDDNNGEQILEILLDCVDSTSRMAVGELWRWLLAKCKMIELDMLKDERHETSITLQFLRMLNSNLHVRAAKAWSRFDQYLELYSALALQTPDQIEHIIRSKNSGTNVQTILIE
jgi:hypothetical protein